MRGSDGRILGGIACYCVCVCLKESLYIMFHGLKAQTLFADVTPTLGLHIHKHTFTLHA